MSAYKYHTNARDTNISQSLEDISPGRKSVHQKSADVSAQPAAFTDELPLHKAFSGHTFSGHTFSSHASFTTEQPSRRNAQDCFVVESLKISGDALMGKVNDLIGQGNVHRIVIKNKEGHTLLSVPTTIKAMGSSLNTILSSEETAINIISAIVPYPKLVVEKLVKQYL